MDWYRVGQEGVWLAGGSGTAGIECFGRSVTVSSLFGCVLTVNGTASVASDVPDELRVSKSSVVDYDTMILMYIHVWYTP